MKQNVVGMIFYMHNIISSESLHRLLTGCRSHTIIYYEICIINNFFIIFHQCCQNHQSGLCSKYLSYGPRNMAYQIQIHPSKFRPIPHPASIMLLKPCMISQWSGSCKTIVHGCIIQFLGHDSRNCYKTCPKTTLEDAMYSIFYYLYVQHSTLLVLYICTDVLHFPMQMLRLKCHQISILSIILRIYSIMLTNSNSSLKPYYNYSII